MQALSKQVEKFMNHQELLEWERLSLRYDENAIPLYLSYPVESFWKQESTPERYADDLEQADVSFFYVHFPYCKTICHYCMCYKKALKNDSDLDLYIDYLARDFNSFRQLLLDPCSVALKGCALIAHLLHRLV